MTIPPTSGLLGPKTLEDRAVLHLVLAQIAVAITQPPSAALRDFCAKSCCIQCKGDIHHEQYQPEQLSKFTGSTMPLYLLFVPSSPTTLKGLVPCAVVPARNGVGSGV